MPANYPASAWDGTSETRPDADVHRAPDAADWAQLVAEVRAMQAQLLPLGIPADGVLPTSEPATPGYLWASAGVVTVSDGP